jgi:oligosaccharyltransferase complex subunit beta
LTLGTAYGPSLSPQVLLDFTSKEGNILLALSGESSIPSAIQSLLVELDIQTSPDRSSVTVDHFGYDTLSAAEKHDTLLLSKPTPLRSDVKNFFAGEGTIAFPKAVAQTLGNTNPLLAPILKAGKNAYSYNPKEEFEAAEDPFAIGEQISLVTAMQARNNARFTVFGSVEALEDKWFDANVKGIEGKQTKTANRDFAKQVTSWAFKESGVLQVGRVEHHLASERKSSTGHERFETVGESNPKIYRVKNDVVCVKELAAWTLANPIRHSQSSSPNTGTASSSRLSSHPMTPSN